MFGGTIFKMFGIDPKELEKIAAATETRVAAAEKQLTEINEKLDLIINAMSEDDNDDHNVGRRNNSAVCTCPCHAGNHAECCCSCADYPIAP